MAEGFESSVEVELSRAFSMVVSSSARRGLELSVRSRPQRPFTICFCMIFHSCRSASVR